MGIGWPPFKDCACPFQRSLALSSQAFLFPRPIKLPSLSNHAPYLSHFQPSLTLTYSLAIALRTQNLAHAGFQLHTCAIQFAVARIPTSVSYAQAAVLPIGLATAASGLFEPQYLGLPPPGPTPSANAEKRAILIWGGSSVVGSCAIQMAAATGLIVFTTASAKNHEYVRGLGAAYVFDYSNPNIVKEILAAVVGAGVELVGAYDVISEDDTTEKCAEVVHHFGGGVLLATRLGNRPEGVMLGDVRRSVGKKYYIFFPNLVVCWCLVSEVKTADAGLVNSSSAEPNGY